LAGVQIEEPVTTPSESTVHIAIELSVSSWLIAAGLPGAEVIGRKRHILVDTLGLLLNVVVHPAEVQDRDGARLVLDRRTRCLFSFIEHIFADAGYQGPRAAQAAASTGRWVFEIVKRNELHKFVVPPKRGIVERTLAWINRNRRLARDFEKYARTVAAFVRLAMIRIMLRRLTRPCHSA
jgi:transposase